MNQEKRLFLSVLNWGLGHAVRCIPIIHAAKEAGFKLTIGTDGAAYAFLKSYLPDNTYVRMPHLDLRYSKKNIQLPTLATQLPKMLAWYKADRRFLERHLATHHYCGIISDNRPGIVAKNVKSVYITHQLGIRAGVFSGFASFVHRQFMEVFDEVWIPDFEQNGLAGALSHPTKMPKNAIYIGPLSNLIASDAEPKYAATILLSGLEPQRTILENALAQQKTTAKICLIRGSEKTPETNWPTQWDVHDFADRKKVQQLFEQSEAVVARCGYSTLMDLEHFYRPALLIPTPGQTEQEYLAKLPTTQQRFSVQSQNALDLESGLAEAKQKFSKIALEDVAFTDVTALLIQTFCSTD